MAVTPLWYECISIATTIFKYLGFQIQMQNLHTAAMKLSKQSLSQGENPFFIMAEKIK